MDKKAKFKAALDTIKTNKSTIFKYSIFIAFLTALYYVLSTAQGVDFEENKKVSDIALDLFQSVPKTALFALAYLVLGLIFGLFDIFSNMASFLALNDPVIVISLILVCFALVADLMLNALLQQNDLPAQCDTFAHRFDLTKTAIAVIFGEVVMKVKSNFFDSRKY